MFTRITGACPTSSLEKTKAASDIGCSHVSKYHCMRDQQGYLGQICVQPSWIPAEHCPEYNTVAKKVDAEKCDEALGICSGKTYLSNEVLSYSACLKGIAEEGDTTDASNTTQYMSTQAPVQNHDATTGSPPTLLIIIPLVVIIILVIVGVIVLLQRRMKKRTESENAEDIGLLNIDPFLGSADKLQKTFTSSVLCNRIQKGKSLFLLLTGHQGSGKTSMCKVLYQSVNGILVDVDELGRTDEDAREIDRMIGERKEIDGGRKIIVKCRSLRSLARIPKFFDKSCANILFLDDVFESWSYKPKQRINDTYVIQDLYNRTKTDGDFILILVMTMSTATWTLHKDFLAKSECFRNIVDLTREDLSYEYCFSRGDKLAVLNAHFNGMSDGLSEMKFAENTLKDTNIGTEGETNVYDTVGTTMGTDIKKAGDTTSETDVDKASDITKKVVNAEAEGETNVDYVNYTDLPKLVADILDTTPRDDGFKIGFPLTCALFCKVPAFFKLKEQFFHEPDCKLRDFIKDLRESQDLPKRKHFLTLLYTMLHGVLDIENQDSELLQKIKHLILPETECEFQPSVDSPFLAEVEPGKYFLLHEYISRLVLLEFSGVDTKYIINYVEEETLLKCVRLESDRMANHPFLEYQCFYLPKHRYKTLIERFRSNPAKLREHVIFDNADFLQKFLELNPVQEDIV